MGNKDSAISISFSLISDFLEIMGIYPFTSHIVKSVVMKLNLWSNKISLLIPPIKAETMGFASTAILIFILKFFKIF